MPYLSLSTWPAYQTQSATLHPITGEHFARQAKMPDIKKLFFVLESAEVVPSKAMLAAFQAFRIYLY